jgi:hypothetical protein
MIHKKSKIDLFLRFVSGRIFYVGLAGTFIGLHYLMELLHLSSSGASTEQVTVILNIMKHSMDTIFNTTLIGIVVKLWTDLLIWQKE